MKNSDLFSLYLRMIFSSTDKISLVTGSCLPVLDLLPPEVIAKGFDFWCCDSYTRLDLCARFVCRSNPCPVCLQAGFVHGQGSGLLCA
jgi:hypothetical protein